jgi:hypothetical protein
LISGNFHGAAALKKGDKEWFRYSKETVRREAEANIKHGRNEHYRLERLRLSPLPWTRFEMAQTRWLMRRYHPNSLHRVSILLTRHAFIAAGHGRIVSFAQQQALTLQRTKETA